MPSLILLPLTSTKFLIEHWVCLHSCTLENVVEAQNGEKEKEENGGGDDQVRRLKGERKRSKPNPRLSNPTKHLQGEQLAAGWPAWLTAVCEEVLSGWIPRKADTFEKIDKVGLYMTGIFF